MLSAVRSRLPHICTPDKHPSSQSQTQQDRNSEEPSQHILWNSADSDLFFPGFAMSAEEERKARYTYGLRPDSSVVQIHGSRRAADQCAYMLPSLAAIARSCAAAGKHIRVLDVGCGPGSITVDLARAISEATNGEGEGEVVGCDLSAAVLESAKARAEAEQLEGNVRIRFVQADVYSLPFADAAFDVVHTHQAVSHFHEHVRAIREMLRVCRPGGGMLCMREGDLHTARFLPESEELNECFRTIIRVHSANGGASDAGRKLKFWTLLAGAKREDVVATHSAWSYNTPEGRRKYGQHWPARCTQGIFAEKAVEVGVSRERLEDYALAWKRWMDDPDGSFAMMHGEVIARV